MSSNSPNPTVTSAIATTGTGTTAGTGTKIVDVYPWARLSINEICTQGWSSTEFVERCSAASVPMVALWRNRVAAAGIGEVRRALDDAGVAVSSLCRGGMFPATTQAERRAAIDDNKAAIEEAATLGTDTLVIVCGAAPDNDLANARQHVVEGVAAIVDDARAAGVSLAVEPFHPMMIADRSVIVTLAEALDLVEPHPAEVVGIALDAYHVFWDPHLAKLIERTGERIRCLQISDWVLPIEGGLSSRGLPGEGSIELHRFAEQADATGFDGPIEVEVLSSKLWALDPADALRLVLDSYASLSKP